MSDYFYSLGCCCIRYWRNVDDVGYALTVAALNFAADEENI
jgi:hypothetical protein